MTVFRVYQAQLTELQVAALNGPYGGWDSKPEFTAYANLGMGTVGDRKADTLVRAAVESDLFNHVCDITCEDVAQVFEIGNIGPEENIRRIEGRRMSSVSVGNVVVDTTTGQAWFCNYAGWVELFETTKKELEAAVATNVVLA